MAQIELDDQVLETARRRASDGGYPSVEAYIADIVCLDNQADESEENPNLDHLFTPEILDQIDRAGADIAAGNFYTADEVREHFKQKRAAWQKEHGAL